MPCSLSISKLNRSSPDIIKWEITYDASEAQTLIIEDELEGINGIYKILPILKPRYENFGAAWRDDKL